MPDMGGLDYAGFVRFETRIRDIGILEDVPVLVVVLDGDFSIQDLDRILAEFKKRNY